MCYKSQTNGVRVLRVVYLRLTAAGPGETCRGIKKSRPSIQNDSIYIYIYFGCEYNGEENNERNQRNEGMKKIVVVIITR